jgi:hypothetical protein
VSGYGLTSDRENASSRKNGLDASQLVRKIKTLLNTIQEACFAPFTNEKTL